MILEIVSLEDSEASSEDFVWEKGASIHWVRMILHVVPRIKKE